MYVASDVPFLGEGEVGGTRQGVLHGGQKPLGPRCSGAADPTSVLDDEKWLLLPLSLREGSLWDRPRGAGPPRRWRWAGTAPGLTPPHAGEGRGGGRWREMAGGGGRHPAVAMGAAAGTATSEPRAGGKEVENNRGEQGRQPWPGRAGGAARHVPPPLYPPWQPLLVALDPGHCILPAGLAPHATAQRLRVRGPGSHLATPGAGLPIRKHSSLGSTMGLPRPKSSGHSFGGEGAHGIPAACETCGNTTSSRPLPPCQISLINGFECYEGHRQTYTERSCKKSHVSVEK